MSRGIEDHRETGETPEEGTILAIALRHTALVSTTTDARLNVSNHVT
ncbi:hypothetical protein [Hyphomonas sp.]|nr:hypothetical protein [Hyphomonas sp.]